jgi:molybdopterin/thiamine biosynthesis adenylyltransferase
MANSKFHHEEIYRGGDLVEKLARFQLVICGDGAIGSNLTDNLARQGFSRIRLIDMDRVDTHNINTQIFEEGDVGALKVNATQNRTFRTVGVEIEVVSKELKANNAKKLLKGADLVIDGFDNFDSRLLVQKQCRAAKTPCLHAGLNADYGEVVWDEEYTVPKASKEGDVCDYPLARNIAMLVVIIATEEILDFCLADKPRKLSWSASLKDFCIRPYR